MRNINVDTNSGNGYTSENADLHLSNIRHYPKDDFTVSANGFAEGHYNGTGDAFVSIKGERITRDDDGNVHIAALTLFVTPQQAMTLRDAIDVALTDTE